MDKKSPKETEQIFNGLIQAMFKNPKKKPAAKKPVKKKKAVNK